MINIKRFPKILNLWPPFLFSGIRVVEIAKDFRHIRVKLKLKFWNRNYVGTQYGGSLFSMVDAWYMVMLIENLGKDYSVWDKSAQIFYLKPGRTDVFADFTLTDKDLREIRETLATQDKMEWHRIVPIVDTNNQTIAEVHKLISIKKKTPSLRSGKNA